MVKVDAYSDMGRVIADDFKSGALFYDESRGALFKPTTQQEYYVTNQDRVVRYDGAVQQLSPYFPSSKTFLPTNALLDGEQLIRNRRLEKADILAKPTWTQWAGAAADKVAVEAVSIAAAGAVGGAVLATTQRISGRCLPGHVANDSNHGNVPAPVRGQPVARHVQLGYKNPRADALDKYVEAVTGEPVNRTPAHIGMVGDSPFHPGDLTPPPPPPYFNAPPPPGLGQKMQDSANEQTFVATGAATGAAIGTAVAGPAGAVVGGVIGTIVGALMGVAWNDR